METPKYSLGEIERRWLVDPERAEPLLAGAPSEIRDKYLSATRLRLRHVVRADDSESYKLCKKYGDRHGATESTTNLYLTKAEHAVLDQLPGRVVSKNRYALTTGSIDVYAARHGPVYVLEVEFSDTDTAAAFRPPEYADGEITGDPLLTGHALANLCAGIAIESATPGDFATVLSLNESAVPHVNSIDRNELQALAGQSLSFTVARNDLGDIAGFLLVLADGADYPSLNYRYFSNHYPSFAYVDRIVVAPNARGAGIGSLLYSHLLVRAVADKPLVACEVNLQPPNPASVAFHEGLGFAGVAEQDTEQGRKRVLLMVKELWTAA